MNMRNWMPRWPWIVWWIVGACLLIGTGAVSYARWGWSGLILAALAVILPGCGLSYRWSQKCRAWAMQLESEQVLQPPSSQQRFAIAELDDLSGAWHHAVEQMQQVFAAQRDFTANAAHELRTPLAALRVAGESALREEAVQTSPAHEVIGAMLEEAGRAAKLVDRLLLLAQAESGRMSVELRCAKMAELVTPVLDWLQPLAAEQQQTLRFDVEADGLVEVDENLFRIALENLISNAIRYSPDGSPILARTTRHAPGELALEVLDEGPGIDPDQVRRLFERFYRGVTGPEGGSGLGLPIARWAADAFGGRLEYERRIGQGSLFRLVCREAGHRLNTENSGEGNHLA